MRKIFLHILASLCFSTAFAQDVHLVHEQLKWESDKGAPAFSGAQYDDAALLPVYFKKIALPQGKKAEVSLSNITFSEAALPPHINKDDLTEKINLTAYTGYERKKPYAYISFLPFRKNPATGAIEKAESFTLNIKQVNSGVSIAAAGANKTNSSVLASGKWYKVGIPSTGVYKMDYQFLKDLGMDVNNLNPRNLRVYGNGGGMLPEPNSAFRYDDLQENTIKVVGESDGSFDAGDYILFYAAGPHIWKYDTSDNRYHHQYNIYSDKSYYFITADLGTGKRITAQSGAGTATVTVTSFDDYAFHEVDQVSLLQSGRRWFGEEFDFTTSYDFSFSFSNLKTSTPVYIRSSVAAESYNTASQFFISYNGQQILSQTVASISPSNYPPAGYGATNEATFTASGSTLPITVSYSKPASESKGWLNYLELNVRRNLTFSGTQMAFRDASVIGEAAVEYVLNNASASVNIWEVTDHINVKSQSGTLSGSTFRFIRPGDKLREFIAFTTSGLPVPEAAGKIENQNLHGLSQIDMVIVTVPEFISSANDLADFHKNNSGLTTAVVTTAQIYNEFSSGAQDITAIRDFMKMFYDRAANNEDQMPKYLLLFGDGSYDYKDRVSNNTNFVPTYQSQNWNDQINSFSTDDYFGFLDDTEGNSITDPASKLDVAIGRLPVSTVEQAAGMVNKIKHYSSSSSFGSWRNNVTFIADDEDSNQFLTDSEEHIKKIQNNYPVYNADKIYLDAYQQESTPGGSRYPSVNEAINGKIFSGTFLMNYIGHGGGVGWAHERILELNMIDNWENIDKLPLFVTATCEFSRFDNPDKFSAGERLLLKSDGGAIALVTTVRIVYNHSNRQLSTSFFDELFNPYEGSRLRKLGELVAQGKNNTAASAENTRKFVLLGDPALTPAYPRMNVQTTSVKVDSADSDTLAALAKVIISGNVTDNGALMNNFNGVVYPTIFDKPVATQTLKNDPGSYKTTFYAQKNIIYKGKASVKNGKFAFTFIVPKDIAYQFGSGKISYYADNGSSTDAAGMDSIVIGGTSPFAGQDKKGPQVELFLNDEKFVFGGMTDENPTLLIKLSDENGINTTGNGIGHDITAVLDENDQNPIILNEFYEAELDNYQKGKVEYPLSELEEGPHSITTKAWDVYNNSGEGYTEFIVASSAELSISHVLNYPNPFTTSTYFQFEHNRPGEPLDVEVEIYTISGKLVKKLYVPLIVSDGYRVDDQLHWDGLDQYGDPIGRGVYVYKVSVSTLEGESVEKFEKLVILR